MLWQVEPVTFIAPQGHPRDQIIVLEVIKRGNHHVLIVGGFSNRITITCLRIESCPYKWEAYPYKNTYHGL